MSRAEQPKLYRSFVKGLITEASFLTYPEDASTDELNTVPSRKGNRTRRFGIDYENNFVINNLSYEVQDAVNEYVWRAANNKAEANFICLQLGTKVRFFNLTEDPVSDSLEAFNVDLMSFAASGASEGQIQTNVAQFSSGKGYLFIAHPYVEPLIVAYDDVTNAITVTKVIVQIRDFEGVDDGLANDEEPFTLSKEHQYNLMNQGWVTPGTTTPPGGIVPPNLPFYYNPYSGSGGFYDRYNDIP